MARQKKIVQEPISMEYYRQRVFDCAAMLMGETFDKEEVMNRLIDLSNCPIHPPKVKVIIHEGVALSVLADNPVNLEVVDFDEEYDDAAQLKEYEAQLYKDESLKEIEFTTANFEEEAGE